MYIFICTYTHTYINKAHRVAPTASPTHTIHRRCDLHPPIHFGVAAGKQGPPLPRAVTLRTGSTCKKARAPALTTTAASSTRKIDISHGRLCLATPVRMWVRVACVHADI